MRRWMLLTSMVAALVGLGLACGDSNPPGQPAPDAGLPDAGHPDAGLPDAGTPDSGTPDSGTPDAGLPDSGTPDSGTPDAGVGDQITVSGYTFTPSELTVDPGATVTIHNSDGVPHTVTSEAADDDFTPGGVNGVSFDTGTVSGGGTQTFTIPDTAPSGTVIPFYCAYHTSMMSPANGHITVR